MLRKATLAALLLLLSAPAAHAQEQQAPIDSETVVTVVADVNLTDVAVTETGRTLSGSFSLQGKMGLQSDIVYGVVVRDASDALFLDVKKLGGEESLQEGELKTYPFTYTIPESVKGSASVMLIAETKGGLILGGYELTKGTYRGNGASYSCSSKNAGQVTCSSTLIDTLTAAYVKGSVFGDVIASESKEVKSGGMATFVSALPPGIYYALVTSAKKGETMAIPFRIEGNYGHIQNIAVTDTDEGKLAVVVTAQAVPSKGASVSVDLADAGGESCGNETVPLTGNVASIIVASSCKEGTATVTVRDANGAVMITSATSFSVLTFDEGGPTSTASDSNNLMIILILGALLAATLIYFIWKGGRTSAVVIMFLFAGAIVFGNGTPAHAATWSVSTIISFEVSHTCTGYTNPDASSYLPGGTMTLLSGLSLRSDVEEGSSASCNVGYANDTSGNVLYDAPMQQSGARVVIASAIPVSNSSINQFDPTYSTTGSVSLPVYSSMSAGSHYLSLRPCVWTYNPYPTIMGSKCTPSTMPGAGPTMSFTVSNPPVNCTYTTTTSGSCSVSCGGGTQNLVYTITSPASGGGTCPVTEGQSAGTQPCNTQACNACYPSADPPGYGTSCTSAANSCGATNTGTITCSGTCSATTPSDSSCPVNGSCGSSNNGTYPSTPSSLCSVGIASGVTTNTSTYTWSCTGANGGTDASCSAYRSPVCGSSSGETFSSPPSTNLCSIGAASAVTTNSSTYTWSCANGNGSASCSATRIAPPTTPTGFTASASSCGNNWLNLSWNAVSGATSYQVYRSGTLIYNSTGLAFSDTGLTLGATYSYTITASNSGGTSAPASASGTVSQVCAPATPTGLTATASSCDTGTVSVSWTASSGATSYTLRDGATTIYTGAATSFSHTGLSAGSSHSYTVLASNAGGNSAYSGAVSGTAPNVCAPGTPPASSCGTNYGLSPQDVCTALLTSPIVACRSTMDLYMVRPGGTGAWELWQQNVSGCNGVASCNSMSIKYYSTSNITECVIAPTTPTGFTASASSCGNNWLNLSWNAVSGATSYQVYRSGTLIYNSTGLAFSDTGLTLGATYSYTITASNSAGTSAPASASGMVSNNCPVDGVCASTHYNCSAGTPANGAENSPNWTWTCNGANGGTSPSCSEPIPTPSNVTASCSVNGDMASGSWTLPAGYSLSYVRVWDGTAGTYAYLVPEWSADTGSSFSFTSTPGHTYGVWVHTRLPSGAYSSSVAAPNFTCASLPDLTTTAPTPATAIAGLAATFSATITNSGTGATGASFSNFFQVASAANGGGTLTDLTATTMTALAASGTGTAVSPAYTFPATGTYSIRACADKSSSGNLGTITEANENNNCGGWTDVIVGGYTVSTSANAGGVISPTSYTGVPSGATRSFTITPDAGYTAAASGCSGSLVGTTYTTGAITANCTVTATFSITSNTLTVSKSGTGSGTVTSSPVGISCGADCSESYTYGASVTLTASPSAGSSFTSWSGACTGMGTCTVSMTAAQSVTASFALPDLTAGSMSSSETATAGTSKSFGAAVSNIGAGTAASFPNIFQVANSAITSTIAVVSGGTVSSLAVNASTGVSGSYTLASAGSYNVRACADNNTSWVGSIAESDESNNCGAWQALTVSWPSIGGSCVVSPTTGNIGDTFTWTASATGGDGSYAYSWTGTDGLSGSSESVSKTYSTSGTKAGSVSITSGGNSQTFQCSNSALVNPIPGATLAANPLTVDLGQSSTLAWNSSSCVSTCSCLFADESSPRGASGNRSVTPTVSGDNNYSVTCTASNGTSLPAYATVFVRIPSATIEANPPRVPAGSNTTLTWSASNVDSCTVAGPSGSLASGASNADRSFSGSSQQTINGQSTFTITCQTGGDPATGSVIVNVGNTDFDIF